MPYGDGHGPGWQGPSPEQRTIWNIEHMAGAVAAAGAAQVAINNANAIAQAQAQAYANQVNVRGTVIGAIEQHLTFILGSASVTPDILAHVQAIQVLIGQLG
jgi:hypothetical protein